MTRLSRILLILGQIIFLGIVIFVSKNIVCPFKLIFSIPCPFCGMTRSLYALLNGNILEAIYYNILLVPIMLALIAINIVFIIEIIKNTVIFNFKILCKSRIKIIVGCLVLSIFSVLINLIHGI